MQIGTDSLWIVWQVPCLIRDDVDHCPRIICEFGDLLSANVPTHTVAFGLQLGDEDYRAAGLHFKGFGE